MDNHDLLLQRQKRILLTMNGEKTDRTPLMFSGDIAPARTIYPELTFEDAMLDHFKFAEAVANHYMPKHPNIDMFEAIAKQPRNSGWIWLVRTMRPGVELEKDQMWQFPFDHFMTEEDYDFIIDKGYAAFRDHHAYGRLGYSREEMAEDRVISARESKLYYEAGIPFVYSGAMLAPYDILAFGRGTEFFEDLIEIPEKVHAAIDVMMEEDFAMQGKILPAMVAEREALGEVVMYQVAPCVQANCDLLSRSMFEEFGWPIIKRQADFLLEHGAYVRFHMDANWTNNLDLFADFPKGKCIMDTDGATDLNKCRDILGPVMAFTGAVHPATMAFGNPDEIYKEVRNQIECLGDGFIASASCTIPPNAPEENMDALYAAVGD